MSAQAIWSYEDFAERGIVVDAFIGKRCRAIACGSGANRPAATASRRRRRSRHLL